ncbi:MAG: TlpA disulfide reductase family protein [Candidatus Eisenbacteria bacterium]
MHRMTRKRVAALVGTFVAVAVVAALPVATVSVAKATPGAQLPDLLETHNLTTLDGRTGKLVPAAAPASVVHFWASWCAPCKKELPLLDGLAAELGPRGVKFAAISIDSDPAKARRFVEQQEIHLPVFLDGPDGLAESLALPSIPSTFVVDRRGRVTFATSGSSEEELARLRAHLIGLVQTKGEVASH